MSNSYNFKKVNIQKKERNQERWDESNWYQNAHCTPGGFTQAKLRMICTAAAILQRDISRIQVTNTNMWCA
jgi:hypothetical protein